MSGPQLEAHLRVRAEDLCEILPEPADDRISQVRWTELRSKAPDYRNNRRRKVDIALQSPLPGR
jgi:hypothetical protein